MTERRPEPREALIQAGLILGSELSLPAVLQKIIDLACEVADARYGALGVLGEDGRIEQFITHGITEEEYRAIGALPQGRGILGVLIREARPLRLARIQDDPRSVGFPPNHPPMTSFLGVPLRVRDRVFGNLYLTEKRGADEFTAEDEEAVLTLAAQAAVAVENARLYREARTGQRRLAASAEVTQAILEGRDTDQVLRLIAERARELAMAALATVTTPTAGEGLVVRVATGARADALQGMRFPAEESISGQVMRTRRPLLVPDATADPRASEPVVRVGGIGPALFVPLAGRDEVVGTLLVANLSGGRTFTEEDLTVVELFAGQAAVALEHGRFRKELERLAILEDRERIAQELHDGVVQSLFSVGMSLQAADATADNPEAVRERVAGAVEGIDRAIRDLRNYIFALRPGTEADRQLDRTLRELVGTFSRGTDTVIVPEIDPRVASLLVPYAGALLQAAREALSNAVRHADAQTVSVRLRRGDDEALLEVEDDGKGFDPDAAEGRGQGLANLEARARSMGGILEIEPADPGTLVRIRIPI